MPYGQIISEFRHYDYTDKKSVAITPTSAILKLLNNNEQPPSYSAVLAEKSKQEQYDKTLDLILFMKKTMKDTEILLTSYQHCCQKLEYQNQYLLDLIQKERSIGSTTISFDSRLLVDQSDMNESLNRMNASLQRLIQEAQSSLNSRYHQPAASLKKSQSCPTFSSQLQQKKRYLHSQWKLTIAMKQFLETVNNSNTFEDTTTIHHYHHHHHYYHTPSTNNNLSSLSLSSFIKYAVNTVTDLIPQQNNNNNTLFPTINAPIQSKPIKHRMMFLCTIVISQKFTNLNTLWSKRSRLLSNHWRQNRPHLYHKWMHKSKLFFYVIHLVNKPICCT